MCGIFGVINFDSQPVDEQKVLSARDILSHRGPDDSGIYFSDCHTERSRSVSDEMTSSVALSHRRLSIIDLSPAAHQPMTTADGRYTIVFNGEIYNYQELSKQLSVNSKKLNNTNSSLITYHHSLITKSDTEVILNLFALEGAECLHKLRGMFAFAIWDDKEKKLFAARDRFGIKPFYYLHNNKEFIFSSELKAIKHYKNGLSLSMEGMDAFLKTGSVPAPLTIYQETKSLLPGHWVEIKCDPSTSLRMTIKKYWSFFDLLNSRHTERSRSMTDSTLNDRMDSRLRGNDRFLTSRNDKSSSLLNYDNEAKQIIRNALLDSVKAHMVSDVEVGAFLSGGIDSTAIVSLMRAVGHEKIKTISVTFPGNKLDESKYSNLAAKKYETDHFEYRLEEKELIDDFDKIIQSMDQPTIDGINTYFVSKAAATFGLKVVLSGLGGDELFGGYPSFINVPKYQRIKNFPFAKSGMKAASIALKNKFPAKAIEYFKNPDAPNAEYKLIRGLFTDAELQSLGWQNPNRHPERSRRVFEESPAVIASTRLTTRQEAKQSHNQPFSQSSIQYPVSPPLSRLRRAGSIQHPASSIQFISFLESTFYMRNQLLRDSDVFSMAHSLELRVPFVDHLLYGAVLPYLEGGFDKRHPKKILVDAVGDLPDEIVHRPKQGFTFPFADWMRNGKLKESINESLMSSKMTEYFNKNALVNLQKEFMLNKIHWSRIWALYIATRMNS